ncbi:MAG: glycosyltransferase family 2 protein, partial [Gammaproteobacteria bacterium]
LAGWVEDPHRQVASIRALSVFGNPRAVHRALHAVPRTSGGKPAPGGNSGTAPPAVGFVSYVPGEPDPLPSLQHRIEIRLHCGNRIGIVPPLPPESFSAARAAVLASVSSQALTRSIVEKCVGPAAASLHAHHLKRRRVLCTETFGSLPRRPSVSIVVPLCADGSDLRFLVGALGTDPECRECEAIFVLDGEAARGAAFDALSALSQLHGLPARVIVLRESFGATAARNAGLAEANGRLVVFLGSGVVPVGAGWLGALRTALRSRRGIGAVGARLLSADGAIDEAGTYFEAGALGRLHHHRAFRGWPRAFRPDTSPRPVPAVSADCLAVSRKIALEANGFVEDYLTDEAPGADLCLRIRALGREVAIAPAAELYRLGGTQSVAADDVTRVAEEVDAWQFGRRWADQAVACTTKLARAGDATARALSST